MRIHVLLHDESPKGITKYLITVFSNDSFTLILAYTYSLPATTWTFTKGVVSSSAVSNSKHVVGQSEQ